MPKKKISLGDYASRIERYASSHKLDTYDTLRLAFQLIQSDVESGHVAHIRGFGNFVLGERKVAGCTPDDEVFVFRFQPSKRYKAKLNDRS